MGSPPQDEVWTDLEADSPYTCQQTVERAVGQPHTEPHHRGLLYRAGGPAWEKPWGAVGDGGTG